METEKRLTNFIEELRKVKPLEIALYLLLFLATIAPGFLIIYNFKPSLVTEYDILKLIVFAFSLTLPALCINVIFVGGTSTAIQENRKSLKNWTLKHDVTLGSLITFLFYYLAILVSYILHLKFIIFIIIIFFLEALFISGCAIYVRKIEKEKKLSKEAEGNNSKDMQIGKG